jgi:hypothetical protein
VISSNPVLAFGFQINSCVRDAALASDSPFVRVRVAMALSRAGDNIYAEKLAAHLNADYSSRTVSPRSVLLDGKSL